MAAFSSATVSVGGVTRQSEYQRLMDNTIYLRDRLIVSDTEPVDPETDDIWIDKS